MFELAVLGPVVTRGFGVTRQCLTCRRALTRDGAARCYGFGPGCMEYRPREKTTEKPASRRETAM